ncbi:MAG: cytochrome c [Deltaproteobacteria bacterium]|nr:cytochrome c [Deltaproteobacteria bacterium]
MPKVSAAQRISIVALSLLAAACAPDLALARDDVPDEIRKQANPVELEESEVRYYTRQFKSKCSRCHGLDGTGKGETEPDGLVRPANLTDVAYMAARTDGQLFYQILMGGGDRCAMPAFGPESDHAWTEEKIWHMVAFVRRFAERPSP